MMNHDQAAVHFAHVIAAELLRLGITKPEREHVGVAIAEVEGLKIVVSIARYDGPMRIYIRHDVDPSQFPPGVIRVPPPPTPPLPPLREVEQAAYDASPMPDKMPVSVKKLATKAGYCCNTYFRDAVRRLIDLGLIVRCTGGVKRA